MLACSCAPANLVLRTVLTPNTGRLGDDHCNVFLFSLSVWGLTKYLNTPYYPYPRRVVRCSIRLGALDLSSFQEVAGLDELRNYAHASLLVNTQGCVRCLALHKEQCLSSDFILWIGLQG